MIAMTASKPRAKVLRHAAPPLSERRDRHEMKRGQTASPVENIPSDSAFKTLDALAQRAERLCSISIQYIDNPEFRDHDCAARFLDEMVAEPAASAVQGRDEDESDDAMDEETRRVLPPHLAHLRGTRLLSKHEEAHLFRKMNYLKYLADELRKKINRRRPNPASLDRLEELLAEAVAVRNELIGANLRLVVSVAKRYVDSANGFTDLVSDGNMSLMQAIEKFDYARGFRFSTYATWALRYNFARAVATRRERDKRLVHDDELVLDLPDESEPTSIAAVEADESRVRSAVGKILRRLDDREREVIRRRFGIGRGQQERTLQQIARDLGVCKERVRQIQLRAMSKLREYADCLRLSPEGDG